MYESPLENLSDEVILNILGYVKIQDLINSGSAEKSGHQNTTPVFFWTRKRKDLWIWNFKKSTKAIGSFLRLLWPNWWSVLGYLITW